MSINTNDIVDFAVTTKKIHNHSITTSKLKNCSVTSEKICDGAITCKKLDPALCFCESFHYERSIDTSQTNPEIIAIPETPGKKRVALNIYEEDGGNSEIIVTATTTIGAIAVSGKLPLFPTFLMDGNILNITISCQATYCPLPIDLHVYGIVTGI
jgi:hypothetical protein